jgi:hypothetical protein
VMLGKRVLQLAYASLHEIVRIGGFIVHV